MNEKEIKKLEKKISDLQKEVDLLRKVNELEQEIKRLKEAAPIVIPYTPYVPWQPYQPYGPWTITWGDDVVTSTTYTYGANANDPNVLLTHN